MGFYQWMVSEGRKESTCRQYLRNMILLYGDDGKSPKAMASQEYFRLVKDSPANKLCHGQRSAAVKQFRDYAALPTTPGFDETFPEVDKSLEKLCSLLSGGSSGAKTSPS